jgi:hypothetical protein
VRLLFTLGLSFLVGTLWEVYEFSFDQITNGNTQDWVFQSGQNNLFPALNREEDLLRHERFGLIDTMTDIIMNTAGALLASMQLRVWPYRHTRKQTSGIRKGA